MWSLESNVILGETSHNQISQYCCRKYSMWVVDYSFPVCYLLWKEGVGKEGGRKLPQLRNGLDVKITHLCANPSSTWELVGIQYHWVLKCAFTNYLFLKVLWQGFISSCVWIWAHREDTQRPNLEACMFLVWHVRQRLCGSHMFQILFFITSFAESFVFSL